jgi:hypothetical protein
MTNEKILNRFYGICGFLEKSRNAVKAGKTVLAARYIEEAQLWADEFCEGLRKKLAKEKIHVKSTTKKP